MLDLTTNKGRYISAALALAAEQRWSDVTLADIAARAGTPLSELKAHFATKPAILSAFMDMVDDEILSRAVRPEEGQPKRDALFEVVMSRFDVLQPWKTSLRSIAGKGPPDPGQVPQILSSNRWMLEAAGIGAGGIDGMARVAGLAAVYGAVFRIWLDDDDPGLARTMAALDRRLRRGEQALRRADDLFGGLRRIAGAVCGAASSVRSRASTAAGRREAGRAGPGDEPSAPAAS